MTPSSDKLVWAVAIISQDAEIDAIGIAAHIVLAELERLHDIDRQKTFEMNVLVKENRTLLAENANLRDERELKIALDATVDRLEESLVNQQQQIEDLHKDNALLQRSHDRYEALRRLNPREFTALWQANIRGDGSFDHLVDRRIEENRLK